MIRVAPAGWAYKDWDRIVYPEAKPRGFDPPAYLAQYFDTIEINSSFYGAPRQTAAKKWVASVAPNSRFTAKLFQSFTHARKPARRDEKEFKDGIAPIVEAGRLGAATAVPVVVINLGGSQIKTVSNPHIFWIVGYASRGR